MTIAKSGPRRVLILADDSANWEVAGLKQLDRLALALDEAVAQLQPNQRTEMLVRWDSTISDRWLPDDQRLTALDILNGSEDSADQSNDLVLDTHMFPFREALGGLMEQTAAISEQNWRDNFGYYLHSPAEIPACERTYLRRGGKPQDGFVSRFLNRPISRALSRHLLKFPITPSGWTLFILVFPMIGALFLVRGNYAGTVAGVILFHLYSVLDGCDGEIARAKFLESEKGRRLDGLCDIATNLLLAVALGIGLSGHVWEGLVVATLIATNEWFLAARHSRVTETAQIPSVGAIYPRHQEMWKYSGIGILGDRFTAWLIQLTKRDFAMLGFVVLAIIGLPAWILHLLGATAAISLVLALKATRAADR